MQNIIPNSTIQKRTALTFGEHSFYYFSMFMCKVGEKEKGRMDA